jgi:hypothetical protein
VLRQIAIQVWQSIAGPRRSADREWDSEVSRTDALVGLLSVWAANPSLGVHSAIRSLNHADRVGPSRELAIASANLGIAAGFVLRTCVASPRAQGHHPPYGRPSILS